MMIPLKKHLLLSWIFLVAVTPARVSADCPHCYNVARVRLLMKNGDKEIGYVPIYGGYIGSGEISESCDLKEAFLPRTKEIYFVRTYYSFPNVGPMVISEDIQKLSLSEIETIVFLSWEDFAGAGEVASLPRETVTKLRTKRILNVQTARGSCVTYVYINQNPKVSDKELELLIKYWPESVEDHFELIYHSIVHNKNSPLSAGVRDAIQHALDQLRGDVENLSYPCTNKEIGDYLDYIRTKYEKRIRFYEAILSCKENRDTRSIVAFCTHEVDDEQLRDHIYRTVKYSNTEERIAANIMEILGPLRELLCFHDFALFDVAIEENDIIVFEYWWD